MIKPNSLVLRVMGVFFSSEGLVPAGSLLENTLKLARRAIKSLSQGDARNTREFCFLRKHPELIESETLRVE